jgi:hypothetical protein
MPQPMSKDRMEVFTILERDKGGSPFWLRIGMAFRNKDDVSWNIYLDALPLDGKLQLRPALERKGEAPVEGQE